MNIPQPNHFTLITVKNVYVARTVAHSILRKYNVPALIVDSTAFEGYNIEIRDEFMESREELRGYAEAVKDLLEGIFNFDLP